MNELAPQPAPDAAPVENTGEPTTSSTVTPDPAKDSPAYQKRIDKLTWEKNDLRRQLDELRARPEPKAPASETPKPPTRAEHDFDEDKYQAAVLDYSRAVARQEAREELKKEREQQTANERKSNWEKRQEEFIKSKPDYREKVLENPSLAVTNEMAQVIAESDLGPEIAYYLGENEEKAAEIARLSPTRQAVEIGRIEARLEAAKQAPPPPPKQSEAPPPVPKIEAVDPVVSKDPKDMSDSEFSKWYRKKRGLKG